MRDRIFLIRASARHVLAGRVTQALITLNETARARLLEMRRSFAFLRGQESKSKLRGVEYDGIPAKIVWVDNDEDAVAATKATGIDPYLHADPVKLDSDQLAALDAYGAIYGALTVMEYTVATEYGVRFHASAPNMADDFSTYTLTWKDIE